MRIDILTLFPKMFENVLNESIIKRARQAGRVTINVHNLRDWTRDRHRTADDKPFGGGAGMVMKPEPIFEAVDDIAGKANAKPRHCEEPSQRRRRSPRKRGSNLLTRIILLSPQGKRLDQKTAKRLSRRRHLILICGHYEGVDERVRSELVTDEISIGDYVLTCGELPAMVLIDAVVRLIPKVLGHKDSAKYESFEKGLLEYPQYTRPAEYRGLKVPDTLLSGNHERIEKWRKHQSLKRTKTRRPDLLSRPRHCEEPLHGRGRRSNLHNSIH